MKVSTLAIAASASLLFGCASAPGPSAEPKAGLTPASYTETTAAPAPAPAAGRQFSVCDPKVVEHRAVMKDSCLNRVIQSPTEGKNFFAPTREKKELRNLCNNMALPRCRSNN